MTKLFAFLLTGFSLAFTQSVAITAEPKVVHVFVALCDNKHQGIIKVNEELGNGQNPKWNLYWGAMYGVKTFFNKSPHWTAVETEKPKNEFILDRLAFRYKAEDHVVYVVADAYDGARMKTTLMDFFHAAAGRGLERIEITDGEDKIDLHGGDGSDMVCFVGHNGLMDMKIEHFPDNEEVDNPECSVVLACRSHKYFVGPLRKAKCKPLITTTQLMCPEAYTLDAIIRSWISGDEDQETRKKAGAAYAKYQKCSTRAGENVFKTGWDDK